MSGTGHQDPEQANDARIRHPRLRRGQVTQSTVELRARLDEPALGTLVAPWPRVLRVWFRRVQPVRLATRGRTLRFTRWGVAMMSISASQPHIYWAPSAQGGPTKGVNGWIARRPLTAFLVLALGLSWLLLLVPVLAFHGVISDGGLPIEVFALGATLLVLLPLALWVTAVTDGRPGVRALFQRIFRWRFGVGWWAVVLLGLPAIALLLGVIFGGSLHTAGAGTVLFKQLASILLAVAVINLWEEAVWAGFFQTRLESRLPFVVAAALTAIPFAGVHVPLLFLDDDISVGSVLAGTGGLLILGLAVRLLLGITLRGAADSVLAVGVLHQVFDASNNQGALVDSLLDHARADVMAEVATVVLILLLAFVVRRRGPGAFARRRTPDLAPQPSAPSM